MLTISTKMKVYQANVLSTLLYGSETCTMYIWQERRLNSFLLRILGITWQNRFSNTKLLALHTGFHKDAYAGSAMSAECRMAGFLRTSCMASSPPAPDQQAD